MLGVGVEGNGLAIALFAMTMAGAALAWRVQNSSVNSDAAAARPRARLNGKIG
jgi:hypothetical protein